LNERSQGKLTQFSIRQVLAQNTGGSIITIMAALARDHRSFTRAVAELTGVWGRAGQVTGREKDRIGSCAARASRPAAAGAEGSK
jgi:hypothetical protein